MAYQTQPGVHDSNAARAAVADRYMQECTGLWIVAPITRAVDDKTAKNLLGDSFKLQLKFDGIQSGVSFICSKTDDISITEAAESLNIEVEVGDSWGRSEELKRHRASLAHEKAKTIARKSAIDDKIDKLDTEIEVWENLVKDIQMGGTAFAPMEESKKRKRSRTPFRRRKDLAMSDEESDSPGSESDKENSKPSQSSEHREPLSECDAVAMVGRLKQEKQEFKDDRKKAVAKNAKLEKEISAADDDREALLSKVKAACIKGRNEYSREAIKLDYAMGMKE